MIKINVIIDDEKWYNFIKNPKFYIKRKISKINKKEKTYSKKKIYCTLLLSSDKEVKYLNKRFRKKNKATDVLSFPFQEKKKLKNLFIKKKEIYLGDIIINLNKISNRDLKVFKLEFDKLWIHGLTHLFGYDHKKEKDFYKMNQIEKKYFNLVNVR